jgi:hypothetical protein
MTLPSKRIIQSATYDNYEEPDVTDEEAEEITEAISCGRLLFFVATSGQDRYTSNHNEVDLTYYRDPRSGEFRYAVETWLGPRKWMYDFDNETAAREQVDRDRQMVKL